MGIDHQSKTAPLDRALDCESIKRASIVIVASRFNSRIVDLLTAGALDALVQAGMPREQIGVIQVPGAFEIPLAVQNVLAIPSIQGVVALGAVIRGETPHFEYVASQTARGILKVSLKYNKPVGFGVLTVDTLEQALDRAGGAFGNKGAEAAQTVISMIEMIDLLAVLQ